MSMILETSSLKNGDLIEFWGTTAIFLGVVPQSDISRFNALCRIENDDSVTINLDFEYEGFTLFSKLCLESSKGIPKEIKKEHLTFCFLWDETREFQIGKLPKQMVILPRLENITNLELNDGLKLLQSI